MLLPPTPYPHNLERATIGNSMGGMRGIPIFVQQQLFSCHTTNLPHLHAPTPPRPASLTALSKGVHSYMLAQCLDLNIRRKELIQIGPKEN